MTTHGRTTTGHVLRGWVRVAAAFGLLLLVATQLFCEERRVTWQQVPGPMVSNRKAEVHLRDGAILRGKALSVTREGLVMVISKVVTQDPLGKYAKGQSQIPADSIRTLRVDRTGRRGRITGGSVGAALGVGMGFFAQDDAQAVAGYGAGPAVVGYLLGWLLDRKSVTFEIAASP